MATLEGKKVVIVGGTSGIGFSVAKASLLSLASHVVVASSSSEKVNTTIEKLNAIISEKKLTGKVSGGTLDALNAGSIKEFFEKTGSMDHLVWTSGDRLRMGFPNLDLESVKSKFFLPIFVSFDSECMITDAFEVRFWGPLQSAQIAKINPGGSITLTVGKRNFYSSLLSRSYNR